MKYNFYSEDCIELLAHLQKRASITSQKSKRGVSKYVILSGPLAPMVAKLVEKTTGKKTNEPVIDKRPYKGKFYSTIRVNLTDFIHEAENTGWKFGVNNRNIPEYLFKNKELLKKYIEIVFDTIRVHRHRGTFKNDGVHLVTASEMILRVKNCQYAEQLKFALSKFGIEVLVVKTKPTKTRIAYDTIIYKKTEMIKFLTTFNIQHRGEIRDFLKNELLNSLNIDTIDVMSKKFEPKVVYHEVG